MDEIQRCFYSTQIYKWGFWLSKPSIIFFVQKWFLIHFTCFRMFFSHLFASDFPVATAPLQSVLLKDRRMRLPSQYFLGHSWTQSLLSLELILRWKPGKTNFLGHKGQLIFKWFFWVIDFLQKIYKRIRLYHYDTSGRPVFVRFLEEIEDTKKPFQKLTDL